MIGSYAVLCFFVGVLIGFLYGWNMAKGGYKMGFDCPCCDGYGKMQDDPDTPFYTCNFCHGKGKVWIFKKIQWAWWSRRNKDKGVF